MGSDGKAVVPEHGGWGWGLKQEDLEFKTSLHSECHREFYQLHCEFKSNPGLYNKRLCLQDSQWLQLSYTSSLMNFYSESSW